MTKNKMAVSLLFCLAVSPSLSSAAQEAAPYDQGVSAYLEKRYEDAISHLSEAISSGEDAGKASRLLKRVFIETMDGAQNLENNFKAMALLKRAKHYFPQDKDILALERRLINKRFDINKSAPLTENEKNVSVKKNKNEPLGKSKPASAALSDTAAPRQREPQKTGAATKPKSRQSVLVWLIGLSCMGLLTLYRQNKKHYEKQTALQEELLKQQMKFLEENLKNQAEEKKQLLKELELKNQDLARKAQDMLKIKEEALKQWQAREESLRRDMREQERRLKEEMTARQQKESDAQAQAQIETRWREVLPPKDGKPKKMQVQFQKKRILETLVNVTTDTDDQAAWERIAQQGSLLHEMAPQEATAFFKQLAADRNPKIRAGIIRALAQIATPDLLEILFALRLDLDAHVKREVIKYIKQLLGTPPGAAALPEVYKAQFSQFLQEETVKAEWVF